MSITLTDRDSGTIVLAQATADASGVGYSVAGGTLADYRTAAARHSDLGTVSKNSRHNFHLERSKINSLGVLKTLKVDLTLSVPNDGTFSADEVDDAATEAFSYFDSETTTSNFIIGVSRS